MSVTTRAQARARHGSSPKRPPRPGMVAETLGQDGTEDGAPLLARAVASFNVQGGAAWGGGWASQLGRWVQQHPLDLQSDAAFTALLVLPLLFWWGCVLAGVLLYEGLPDGQKRIEHAMIWFDRGVIRPMGAGVPFAVLVGRAGFMAIADLATHFNGSRRERRRTFRLVLATLAWDVGLVYCALAVLRGALYLLHWALLQEGMLPFHLVSDHVFLAATMLISLHVELVCVLADVARAYGRRQFGRQAALHIVQLAAIMLYGCTAADMFFTAKYYHTPWETITTVAVVFVLFQLPVLAWVRMKRMRAALA